MKLTGAFLAEYATAADGKLNVEGGLLRNFPVGYDRVVRATLVILADFLASDAAPTVTVELITPSGDSQTTRVDVPHTAPSDTPYGEPGFALWPLWIPAETDGEYQLVVSADEGSVRLRFNVRGA